MWLLVSGDNDLLINSHKYEFYPCEWETNKLYFDVAFVMTRADVRGLFRRNQRVLALSGSKWYFWLISSPAKWWTQAQQMNVKSWWALIYFGERKNGQNSNYIHVTILSENTNAFNKNSPLESYFLHSLAKFSCHFRFLEDSPGCDLLLGFFLSAGIHQGEGLVFMICCLPQWLYITVRP